MLKKLLDTQISVKCFLMLLTLAYVLYLFPYITSQHYFMDDNVRVIIGNPDWGWQGRPLADYIMYFLSSNIKRITNLNPMPLLLSMGLLLSVIYYTIKKHINNIEVKLLIPYFLIIGNPFFVHNLLYQYDSSLMISAMSLAIFAFFYENNNKIKENGMTILSLIASLSLYQPCANIYLALIAGNFLVKIKKHHSLNELYAEIIKFCFSTGLYYLIVMKILGFSTPRSHFLSFSHPFEIIKTTFDKMEFFVSSLFLNIPVMQFSLIIIFFCMFLLVTIKEIIKEKKLHCKILLILSPLALFLSLWGGLLLIREPLIQPREFVVFSAILFIISFSVIQVYSNQILNIFALLLVIFCFAFSYNTYNVFKEQKQFEERIYNNIYSDIIGHTKLYEAAKIYINGRPMKSPVLAIESQSTPIYNSFIEPADKWVTRYSLIRMGIKNIQDGFADDNKTQLLLICEEKPFIENLYYNIYLINHSAVLWFKTIDKKNKSEYIIPCAT